MFKEADLIIASSYYVYSIYDGPSKHLWKLYIIFFKNIMNGFQNCLAPK